VVSPLMDYNTTRVFASDELKPCIEKQCEYRIP